MFFKLSVVGNDCEKVSYIISKHPNNIFQREVGKRGKIIAKFEQFGDYRVVYKGHIENYPLPFYKICRDENRSSYVTSEQYSVCPYNLELLDIVFRSVLRGNFQDISKDDFDREYEMEMMLGPYSLYNISRLKDAFRAFGYNVKSNVDEFGPYALMVSGKNNLTTFLQQIYVISYAYTNHLRQIIPQKQDVNKYLNLSKGWIEDHPFRNYLINRISKVRRNIKTFEIGLLEDQGVESASEKVKEKMDSFKVKASELRYRTIIDFIEPSDSVLDFGCGNGNLINRILGVKKPKKLIGFDSDKRCVNTAYKRGKQQIRWKKNKDTKFSTFSGSILYPDYSLFEDIDKVVLSEVIEHFHMDEVDKVLDIIFKGINPRTVILTTPNKDYNVNFNIEEDQLRHPDHKFEFTQEEIVQFANKVKEKYGYSFKFIISQYSTSESGLEDKNVLVWLLSEEPQNTLSFIMKFERGELIQKKDEKLIGINKLLYSPFDLDASAYQISSKTIREGSATFGHKIDPRWIVSLAPTMSPADSSEREGCVEHPFDAIEYYKKRGICDLILEVKYMGSRGTIVATNNKDISQKLFGSDKLMQIYSRKGYKFFDESKIEGEIYCEIKDFMEDMGVNIIALDTEILPWSYKGETLIEKEFEKPGKCALLHKQYTGRSTDHEYKYLKSLSNYSKKTNIQIYPFSILLSANFDGRKFRNISNGFYINHSYQLEALRVLSGGSSIFNNVNFMLYKCGETNDFSVMEFWERIIKFGLEGMVVKPLYPTQFLSSGRYIQPALKCRTPDYLRIIYGIDYLDPENLAFLKRRKTASKRKLAMQQFELSQKILYSFINRNNIERLKYIFGFFGMESVSNIDNTL